MSAITGDPTVSRAIGANSRFFLWLSVSYLAVALVTFSPFYWVPLINGSLAANPAVHFHAALFFAWTALLVTQNWLVVEGRIRSHRSFGMLGIALATLMTVSAVLAAMNRARLIELPAGVSRAPIEQIFVGGVAIDVLAFAVLFAVAIVRARDTESHRRLMLLATVHLLGAGLNRVFRFAPEIAAYVRTEFGLPLPILTADLLLVPLLVHDWRSRGRLHRATAWGTGALLLLHFVEVRLYESELSAFIGRVLLGFLG